MALKIIRNDITKMKVDAVVNTANAEPMVGDGCDTAIYNAAGFDELLEIRKGIGHLDEGEVAITPGLSLPATYIIHAVSPFYIEGDDAVEAKLRNCYKNSLWLAYEKGIRSIAFPLIATGSYGYPKEEGLRIAVDEINAFLLKHEMDIYLVVFSGETYALAKHIDPGLESYIDEKYMSKLVEQEYAFSAESIKPTWGKKGDHGDVSDKTILPSDGSGEHKEYDEELDGHQIDEHLSHLSDSFSEYLMYLIQAKGLKNAEVYKHAIVDKKIFSKIKNDANYKPSKITALCLCVGAKLNLDQAKDLLARAGYALSPADKTDIIFAYFIEHEIYDMIELDIQLEEHGEKCIIS